MLSLLIFYTLLWFLIAGFSLKSLFFGFTAIGSTLFVHKLIKIRIPRINFLALMSFSLEFLILSFLSGVDVAKRILNPKLMVKPGFVVYNLNTDRKPVIYLLAIILNLTPGTLTVRVERDYLLIHSLDIESYKEKNIRRLEKLIGIIFP